jgi:CheY-like chemotaxis protein
MYILFLTNDLVFPSRVQGAAQACGARMITAPNVDTLLAKYGEAASSVDAAESASLALLDLNAAGVDAAQVVPRLKELSPPPKAIIAYGPHVHEHKLAAAQEAGCDLVLTRGQFDAQMAELLRRYLA